MLVSASVANASSFHRTLIPRKGEGDGEVRRHIERLLLRLDFNGNFSRSKSQAPEEEDFGILKQGGL